MIKCLICNKFLGMMTESHTKKFHNISCREYAQRFNLKRGEINPHHSKNMSGQGNPRYKAIVSQETREKIRNIHKIKGTFKGKRNPMYGKTHNEEVRKRISDHHKIALLGVNNPFYGKKHSEDTKKKISEIHKKRGLFKGERNPMYNKNHKTETKIRISQIKKEFFIKYPEKSINSIIARNYKKQENKKGGYISKNQIKIYQIIKKEFPDAKLNYPIITKDTVYFADVGIPSLKLDIEYDGYYWHNNKLKEIQRDKNIENVGWKIIRIKEEKFNKIIINEGLIKHIKLIIQFNIFNEF